MTYYFTVRGNSLAEIEHEVVRMIKDGKWEVEKPIHHSAIVGTFLGKKYACKLRFIPERDRRQAHD